MRNRPWIAAALVSACGLLPMTFAALIALEFLAGSYALVATPSGTVIRTAGAAETTGSGNWAETIPDPEDSVSVPPPAFILDNRDVRGVLGSAVRSAADEDMGRIVDVIVDRSGITRAGVIDFGGFLGVGSRKIAVDWNSMRFERAGRITLDMTRDEVKAAPQYEMGKPIVVLGAASERGRSRVTERMLER